MPIQQENYSDNQLDLIQEGTSLNAYNSDYDYIRLTIYRKNGSNAFVDRFYSNELTPDGIPQVEVYSSVPGDLSVKPNEILEANYVAGGEYDLQFDFLRNIFSYWNDAGDPPNFQYPEGEFIITEISPSRKEIRLIARNAGTGEIPFDGAFQTIFDSALSPTGEFTYDWVLTFKKEKNISINNYTFDELSNPNETTLILRLDKPIYPEFKKLDKINIEKEVINTQIQDIIYVSNITSIFAGSGLTPDPSVYEQEIVYEIDEAENYNQLIESASFTENTLEDIKRKQNEDINLNIDFSEFGNHTVFGSATKKLENFKTKVGDIQHQLNIISESLLISSSKTGSYIPQKRKAAFSEIQTIQSTFTPYERFLYFDNQSQTTASAPGLGMNYAHTNPVNQNDDYTLLKNHDGFKIVHKHKAKSDADQYVDIFTNKYRVEDSPFFNYTGSIYLSFLMKSDSERLLHPSGNLVFSTDANENNSWNAHKPKIPSKAGHHETILKPNITGSHYQRIILMASQSHWRPTGSAIISEVASTDNIPDNNSTGFGDAGEGVYYQILSSSTQVASASLSGSNSYPITLGSGYDTLGTTFTGSGVAFTGSIMPAGELFRVSWTNPNFATNQDTASFTTDIKITLEDPSNVKPFSFIYPTGSTEFDNWYDAHYVSASTFDNNNIHSLLKNVPEQIITGSNEIETFLHMWGEHFDGVRNYIDTYKTFYKREYNEINSVPSNLLPILGDNLGWELINPFSSSIADYFSTITGSLSTVQDITNNTWRKVINNLIYIYKSKGTSNSLRALLNIYGYPPDLINVNEMGGSQEELNPVIIDDTYSTFKAGLNGVAGNVSFRKEPSLYRMMNFNLTHSLQLDWHMNDANGDGVEFSMIPSQTATSMSLLESSGSGQEKAWDLYYVPSASNVSKGSVRLRIYDALLSGSSAGIEHNAESASTDYFDIGNDRMFNVFMGTMTSSADETATTQSYKVVVASKDDTAVNLLTTASLNTITSSIQTNFRNTGSRHPASASNLYVGRTFQGRLADIRLWKGFLSASKIKQHTLNPSSVVGNNINSYGNEIVWRFKLSENHLSGSTGKKLVDSNPDYIKDYSRDIDFGINLNTYTSKLIDLVKLIPRGDVGAQKNDNMITVDSDRTMLKNLNPFEKSFVSNYDFNSTKQRKLSSTVDFTKSPTDKIDDHITQILAGKDITQYYTKWSDLYEPFYKDLDDLRDEILSGVSVDINTYISTQARLFNPFILEAIQSLLPARAKLEKGVSIKQNILERTKVEYKKAGLLTIPIYKGSIEDIWDFGTSVYVDPYVGELEDEPSVGIDFITPSSDELTTDDLFEYSMNYTNIYKSDELKIYEEFVEYDINYINLINSNVLSIINQEENFSVLYVEPKQSNIMNIYEDFISWTIDYVNLIKSNKMNIYEDFVTYSILFVNPYESNKMNIYEDFVDYTIDYIDVYNSNVENWPYQSLSMEFADKTNSSKLASGVVGLLDTNLPDWEYQSLSGSYEAITETNLKNWQFQSFSSSYESIYETNLQDWQFQSFSSSYESIYETNLLDWEFQSFSSSYESIYETDLPEWEYQSLSMSYDSVKESNMERWPYESFSGSYESIKETNLEKWPYESLSSSYESIKETDLPEWEYQSLSMSYDSTKETNMERWPYDSLSSSYDSVKETNMEKWPYDSFSASYNDVEEVDMLEWPFENLNMKYNKIYTTSSTEVQDIYWVNPKESPLKSSGTSSSDTWIMNMDVSGSSGDHNTGYYSDEVINYMIGDMEFQSGSKKVVNCAGLGELTPTDPRRQCLTEEYCDASDWTCLKNRLVINDGRDVHYQSYFGPTGAGGGAQKGRPVGKTTFIATSSNGTLIYPSNHHINYSTTKDQMRYLFYEKTPQNIIKIHTLGNKDYFESSSYGRGHWPDGKDLFVTESVYTITVDGSDTDNILKVQRLEDRPGNITTSGPGPKGKLPDTKN